MSSFDLASIVRRQQDRRRTRVTDYETESDLTRVLEEVKRLRKGGRDAIVGLVHVCGVDDTWVTRELGAYYLNIRGLNSIL